MIDTIKRSGKPEEIADSIIYLLSGKASYITGQVLAVNGGFTLK
ncbi:MAG: SDR family oxidoreductase [Clostridia bacterium]